MDELHFRVWDADASEEDGIDIAVGTEPYEALDAEDAAEEFCERRYHHDDYPNERTVCARDPNGAVTRWNVRAERVVEFFAKQAP